MRIELLALLFFQIRDALTQRQVNLRTSALSIFFLSCCVGIPKKVAVYVFESGFVLWIVMPLASSYPITSLVF
jgi:hypothetical protein